MGRRKSAHFHLESLSCFEVWPLTCFGVFEGGIYRALRYESRAFSCVVTTSKPLPRLMYHFRMWC